jgi:hypothetical protein
MALSNEYLALTHDSPYLVTMGIKLTILLKHGKGWPTTPVISILADVARSEQDVDAYHLLHGR